MSMQAITVLKRRDPEPSVMIGLPGPFRERS